MSGPDGDTAPPSSSQRSAASVSGSGGRALTRRGALDSLTGVLRVAPEALLEGSEDGDDRSDSSDSSTVIDTDPTHHHA
jgi:hypothetical protein